MKPTTDYTKFIAWRILRGIGVATLIFSIANALHPLIHGSFLGGVVAWSSWLLIIITGLMPILICITSISDGIKWYDLLSDKNEVGGPALFAFLLSFAGLLSLKLWHPVIIGRDPGAALGLVLLCFLSFIGMQILLFDDELKLEYIRPQPAPTYDWD